MKTLKLVLMIAVILICIFSLLLPITTFFVSSTIQGHYKASIDDPTKTDEEIREALQKKKIWAEIGESPYWKYSYIIFGISVLVFVILWFIKIK